MPKAKAQSGIAGDIAAMKAIGMTDEQIQAKIMGGAVVTIHSAEGTTHQPAQQLTAPQRQDQNLGPDPEMVRRHREFLATYKAPVLEESFNVTLDKRRADYVRRWAGWQSAIRGGRPITPEQAIDLMVRRLWQLDPDRAFIDAGARAAVPRSHFQHPAAGTPPSVPQG